MFLRTKRGFFKLQIQVVAQVFATLGAAATSPGPGPKKFAEDIAEEILEATSEIEPSTKRTTIAEGSVTKAVVLASLFGIGKDLVRLRSLLKLLLRFFVTGIPIWVVL